MRINTNMARGMEAHYQKELEACRRAISKDQLPKAWRLLERAHILAQPYPYQHSEVHWLMLKFGFRIKDPKEILGQLPRLFVGGVKSFTGTIPVGNTGGANVPPMRPMEIPEDLQELLYNSRLSSITNRLLQTDR